VTKHSRLIYQQLPAVRKTLKPEGNTVTTVCLLCLKVLSCISLKATVYGQILGIYFCIDCSREKKKYSIHFCIAKNFHNSAS